MGLLLITVILGIMVIYLLIDRFLLEKAISKLRNRDTGYGQ